MRARAARLIALRFRVELQLHVPWRLVVKVASSGILPPSPQAGTVQAKVRSVFADAIFDSRNCTDAAQSMRMHAALETPNDGLAWVSVECMHATWAWL